MEEILEILERNSKFSEEEIAAMTGKSAEEVREVIKRFEDQNVIVGYTALVNWENTTKDNVVAMIEVKVTPQRGEGFDSVAERIYRFPEVRACYLISGGYDLTVIVEGKTLKEVARFVSEKLAVQECVLSTATHFVLKKYKDNGTIFEKKQVDDREDIFI